MHIIGKTKYIQQLNKEIKSKAQIVQAYLIVFSFILPQTINTISQIKDPSLQSASNAIVVFSLYIFLIASLSYYRYITTTSHTIFSIRKANFYAIVTSINLSYLISLDIILTMTRENISENYFYVYLIEGIALTAFTIWPLFFKNLRETTLNDVADILTEVNKNKLTILKENIGFVNLFISFLQLLIFILMGLLTFY